MFGYSKVMFGSECHYYYANLQSAVPISTNNRAKLSVSVSGRMPNNFYSHVKPDPFGIN